MTDDVKTEDDPTWWIPTRELTDAEKAFSGGNPPEVRQETTNK